VGSEIDGKGKDFSRPVLIISVKGNTKALVVPLTSTRYKFPGYLDFDFGGRHGSLCIHDLRTISQNRIGDRYGHIYEGKQKVIKEYIKKFFQLD
jgi:mRNA-degrading endonuclease toxin of MazEF toxin-antitoxin module